ncbi:MAG: DUF6709 family protein [Candidatus Acidiferrales bacterium]
MDSWIAQMCRATSRRQFFAWFFILAAGIVFVAFNARYVRNFVEGPFPFQADDLAQITDANTAPHYYASVAGDQVIDTGIQEVTTTTENGAETGKYVSAGYYAFVVGNHVLIVKSAGKPGGKVAGELKPIPSDLSGQLFSDADGQQLQGETYPFYLDTEGFRYPGYWAIAIGCVFLPLFVRFGGRAWVRWQDVSKNPVMKRVSEQWGDVMGVSVDAERELSAGVVYKSGGIFLTDKYTVEKGFFRFNIFRFRDLLWAYKKVTQRRVNFIPTGKSYEAVLVFYGGSKQFSGPETKIHEVLTYASSKAPWAVIGYSKEIADAFNKHTTEFCQAIEARRRDLASAAS